jgi:acyl carrier protein
MTDSDFLQFFADAVGAGEGTVQMDTELSSLEGWDSVAYLSTMTFLDENLGVAVTPDQLLEAVKVSDILTFARAKS